MRRWDSFVFVCNALRAGLLNGERVDWPRQLDWPAILEASGHHCVTAALVWCLRGETGVPDAVAARLRRVLAANTARNALILRELECILSALEARGIAPLLLKGAAHLVGGLYPAPGVRFLTDIDLLLPSDRLWDAAVAVQRIGFVAPPRHAIVELEHHHLPRMRHGISGVAVELHRRVFDPDAAVIPLAAFWDTARPAPFRGRNVLLPGPTAAAAQNIAHAQISHDLRREDYVEIRQLLELALLCGREGPAIDWSEIEAGFKQAGCEHALQDNLAIARKLFGEAVPLPESAAGEGAVARLRRNVERPVYRWPARFARIVSRHVQMLRGRPAAVLNLVAPGMWPARLRLLSEALRPRW